MIPWLADPIWDNQSLLPHSEFSEHQDRPGRWGVSGRVMRRGERPLLKRRGRWDGGRTCVKGVLEREEGLILKFKVNE